MVETTGKPMSTSYSDYYNSNDPEVIRAQIEQTRAQMGRTVDTIQQRLSPERLTREAKDKIKEATIGKVEEMADMVTHKANHWRYSVMETIKHNPIPAALAGIGLGWLLMEGMRSSDRGEVQYHRSTYDFDTHHLYAPEGQESYYERDHRSGMVKNVQHKVSDAAHTVQDKTSQAVRGVKATASNIAETVSDTASNVAATVSDTASNIAETVSDTASNVAHEARDMGYRAQDNVRYQTERAKENFNYALNQNPLAIGAVAFAAGAAVGMMLPSTQKEDELMGETRDHMLEQAKSTAKETVKKAQHVAEEVYEGAKETVKEEAQKQGLTESKPQTGYRIP